MPSTMNHWERIEAALKGQDVDRVPVSLWRHWPGDDETAQGLANAMLRWQQTYDFDLIKFMPTGMYGVHDWGTETIYNPGFRGNRIAVKPGVTDAAQWPKLARLDPRQGAYGQEVEAIRLAAAELKDSVPILQTIFSPLTTAVKLAGERAYADLRARPELLKAGLEIITDVTIRFTQACLEAGAHGVFFATQNATYRLLSEAEYREFGLHYDLQVLNAIRGQTRLNMLHVHGEDIMFDLAATYPVEMINWHDRITWPALKEAQSRFNGALVGGIDDRVTIVEGPIEKIRWQARDAIEQTGGRRLIVGPGCVIPTNTPDAHVRAVIETVREMAAVK
ncbi:MAG TPA: uroporphyrinogen decarboxylase family protein [Caldilineaceae bacterium]|nr:uroporphyrinogen decarboxylase family protein [Caldilineaceae bacterium]